MARIFHKFEYRSAPSTEEAVRITMRGSFDSETDEAVARRYLNDQFMSDGRSAMRGIAAPERPELVPDLKLTSSHVLKEGGKLLRFEQTQQDRPVFGSVAVVQMTADRQSMSASGSIAEVDEINPIPNLSEPLALAKIVQYTGADAEKLAAAVKKAPPHLQFFRKNEADRWHLAYLFTNIPALPPPSKEPTAEHPPSADHGLGPSPRDAFPLVNYLVDAHDGAILFYYSAAPTIVTNLPPPPNPPANFPTPVWLKGNDELGVEQRFYGNKIENPVAWELYDTDRSIKTYDLQFKDIRTTSLPADCIRYEKSTFDKHGGAVSAHVNAFRVYKFYKGELNRNGIDDRGMNLVSVINCTYAGNGNVWTNAVWWNGRMWYGQKYAADNITLKSYSQYLDVIAHELTHGVTQTTANLVYEGQSGALNESISDIFGVIIKNWYEFEAAPPKRDDVSNWNWRIGETLGRDGGPLRDLSNPAVTHDPGHMNDYVQTANDWGGVHANSNIHNKAAYNFLNARDGSGKQVFLPSEVAQLYYRALLGLGKMATFSDILSAILNVAGTFYADAAEAQLKMGAIKQAYVGTGIVE